MGIAEFIHEKKAEFDAFKKEFKDGLKDELQTEAYAQYEKHVGAIAIDNPRHNNDVDAYRHAYVAGRLTQVLLDNQWAAEIILDRHEVHSPNTPYEHRMDGWNNEVGRRFGDEYSKDDLGEKLALELKEGGLLATSPYDERLESLYSQDPKLQAMDVSDDRAMAGENGLTAKEMDKITDDASREIGTLIDARDEVQVKEYDSTAKAIDIANQVYQSPSQEVNDYGRDTHLVSHGVCTVLNKEVEQEAPVQSEDNHTTIEPSQEDTLEYADNGMVILGDEYTVSIDDIELMEEEPFDSLAYAKEIALSVYDSAHDNINVNDMGMERD